MDTFYHGNSRLALAFIAIHQTPLRQPVIPLTATTVRALRQETLVRAASTVSCCHIVILSQFKLAASKVRWPPPAIHVVGSTRISHGPRLRWADCREYRSTLVLCEWRRVTRSMATWPLALYKAEITPCVWRVAARPPAIRWDEFMSSFPFAVVYPFVRWFPLIPEY